MGRPSVEQPVVQILVVVAITRVGRLRTKVEKGFKGMASSQELVGAEE